MADRSPTALLWIIKTLPIFYEQQQPFRVVIVTRSPSGFL